MNDKTLPSLRCRLHSHASIDDGNAQIKRQSPRKSVYILPKARRISTTHQKTSIINLPHEAVAPPPTYEHVDVEQTFQGMRELNDIHTRVEDVIKNFELAMSQEIETEEAFEETLNPLSWKCGEVLLSTHESMTTNCGFVEREYIQALDDNATLTEGNSNHLVDTMQSHHRELKMRLKNLFANTMDIVKELGTKMNSKGGEESELDENSVSNDCLQMIMEKMKKEKFALIQQLEDSTRLYTNVSSSLSHKEELVEKLEIEVQLLNTELMNSNTQVEVLKTDRDRLSENQETIEAWKEKYIALRKKFATAETDISRATDKNELLLNRNSQLNQQNEQLNSELKLANNQLAKMNGQLSDSKLEYEQKVKSLVSSYESNLSDMKISLKKAKDGMRSFMRENEEANAKANHKTSDPSKLKVNHGLSQRPNCNVVEDLFSKQDPIFNELKIFRIADSTDSNCSAKEDEAGSIIDSRSSNYDDDEISDSLSIRRASKIFSDSIKEKSKLILNRYSEDSIKIALRDQEERLTSDYKCNLEGILKNLQSTYSKELKHKNDSIYEARKAIVTLHDCLLESTKERDILVKNVLRTAIGFLSRKTKLRNVQNEYIIQEDDMVGDIQENAMEGDIQEDTIQEDTIQNDVVIQDNIKIITSNSIAANASQIEAPLNSVSNSSAKTVESEKLTGNMNEIATDTCLEEVPLNSVPYSIPESKGDEASTSDTYGVVTNTSLGEGSINSDSQNVTENRCNEVFEGSEMGITAAKPCLPLNVDPNPVIQSNRREIFASGNLNHKKTVDHGQTSTRSNGSHIQDHANISANENNHLVQQSASTLSTQLPVADNTKDITFQTCSDKNFNNSSSLSPSDDINGILSFSPLSKIDDVRSNSQLSSRQGTDPSHSLINKNNRPPTQVPSGKYRKFERTSSENTDRGSNTCDGVKNYIKEKSSIKDDEVLAVYDKRGERNDLIGNRLMTQFKDMLESPEILGETSHSVRRCRTAPNSRSSKNWKLIAAYCLKIKDQVHKDLLQQINNPKFRHQVAQKDFGTQVNFDFEKSTWTDHNLHERTHEMKLDFTIRNTRSTFDGNFDCSKSIGSSSVSKKKQHSSGPHQTTSHTEVNSESSSPQVNVIEPLLAFPIEEGNMDAVSTKGQSSVQCENRKCASQFSLKNQYIEDVSINDAHQSLSLVPPKNDSRLHMIPCMGSGNAEESGLGMRSYIKPVQNVPAKNDLRKLIQSNIQELNVLKSRLNINKWECLLELNRYQTMIKEALEESDLASERKLMIDRKLQILQRKKKNQFLLTHKLLVVEQRSLWQNCMNDIVSLTNLANAKSAPTSAQQIMHCDRRPMMTSRGGGYRTSRTPRLRDLGDPGIGIVNPLLKDAQLMQSNRRERLAVAQSLEEDAGSPRTGLLEDLKLHRIESLAPLLNLNLANCSRDLKQRFLLEIVHFISFGTQGLDHFLQNRYFTKQPNGAAITAILPVGKNSKTKHTKENQVQPSTQTPYLRRKASDLMQKKKYMRMKNMKGNTPLDKLILSEDKLY